MRASSFDQQYGFPLNFFWPYRMSFRFMVVINPEDDDYTLEGKEITFLIQENIAATGVYLLSQSTQDGNITVSGLAITGNIPFAELQTAEIKENKTYKFSLTIGKPVDGNRIQANFISLPETGIIPDGSNNYSISLSDFSAVVNLAVGPAGEKGDPGYSHWPKIRYITAAGNKSYLASDQSIIIDLSGAAGQADYQLPDPLIAYDIDNDFGQEINFTRDPEDSSSFDFNILGTGSQFPILLHPEECITVAATGEKWIVVVY